MAQRAPPSYLAPAPPMIIVHPLWEQSYYCVTNQVSTFVPTSTYPIHSYKVKAINVQKQKVIMALIKTSYI